MTARSTIHPAVKIVAVVCGLLVWHPATGAWANDAGQGDGHAAESTGEGLGQVRVGLAIYADGQGGGCFSNRFLDAVAREAGLEVARRCVPVNLADEAVFEYPLLVMAGQGPFKLSPREQQNLWAYVQRGGLLLASAGCSSAGWAESFERVMAGVSTGAAMQPMPMDHPVFHTLYRIERIPTRKGSGRATLWGLTLADRLAVVFAPMGLNDTANAGGGCCCCGGNEIRNARQINANILIYALTH